MKIDKKTEEFLRKVGIQEVVYTHYDEKGKEIVSSYKIKEKKKNGS